MSLQRRENSMTNLIRPMKAAPLLAPSVEHSDEYILAALQKLHYPVIASLKKDGIRAVRTSDLFSCQMHLIPNVSIRRRSMKLPAGFDCELFNPELSYDEIESIVMTGKTEHPDSHLVQFHCIDWFHPTYSFAQRLDECVKMIQHNWDAAVLPDEHWFTSAEQLFDFFLKCEQQNGEGICFRTPNSPYKQGRSTLREQYLIKLCRYVRTEVMIIGFEEQMMNNNCVRSSPIGLTERSSYKAGMKGKNTLGAFIVRDSISGLEFRVGTGVNLTDKRRQQIWDDQDSWLGSRITIKHKPHGQKIKPRSPIAILDAEYIGPRKEGY